jgi:cytochrome d ubiquinol oxidase subunit II
VLLGVPFHLNDMLMPRYDGNFAIKFIGLLRPFALLAGVVSLSMLLMHGAAWLSLKAEGLCQPRAPDRHHGRDRRHGSYALGRSLAGRRDRRLRFVGEVVTDGPSNPLYSEVARGGSWLSAYASVPGSRRPGHGLCRHGAGAARADRRARGLDAAVVEAGITGVISSVGLTMFPFILPSTVDPNSSLTVWDASSSHQTLFIMLVCTVIFMPLILMYTAWVYKVLWGKVTEADVTGNSDTVY